MNKNYLTLEDRKKIKEFLDKGLPRTRICKELKRSSSVIYFEIEKNGGIKKYDPQEAQKNHEKIIKNSKHLTLEDRKKIKELILNGATKTEIFKKTGFGKSTVYREIGTDKNLYDPEKAHEIALKKIEKGREKIKNSRKKIKFIEQSKEQLKETTQSIQFQEIQELQQRIEMLEMHLEILIQTVKELTNAKT